MGWRDYYSMTPKNRPGGYISMFDGYARNYLDPNSTYNTGMRRDFNKQGQDIASNQYRQGMRMQAAGVNPFASEQYRQASGQARESSMGAYNESVRQSQGLGQNMLGMGLQARTQMSQQEQQQKQWDRELRQHDRGQALSLAGTLMGAALIGGPGEALGRMMKAETAQPLVEISPTEADSINVIPSGGGTQPHLVPPTSEMLEQQNSLLSGLGSQIGQGGVDDELARARAWAKSAGLSNADNMPLERIQYWWNKWNRNYANQWGW